MSSLGPRVGGRTFLEGGRGQRETQSLQETQSKSRKENFGALVTSGPRDMYSNDICRLHIGCRKSHKSVQVPNYC